LQKWLSDLQIKTNESGNISERADQLLANLKELVNEPMAAGATQ